MESDDQGVSVPGVALLLIVGEPFSEEQKTSILLEITKGFRCWDVEDTGIDINEELAQIANRASLGEEGFNGERIIQHQSDNLAVEILINPVVQSLKNSIKKLLIAPAPTKYIIYAGYAFQGSGSWVLQDDTFSFSHLAQVFKIVDVENALKQNIEASLTIHTLADSNWGTNISKADFTNNLRIQLNPAEKLDNIHGVLQFTAYVGGFVRVVPITSILQASEQFGNISFTRPTLYIFPGCQGDSALFGISGFNLLVNGGYSRRACFWDFARHLDRVDAMLMTHLGTDNIFGLSSVLQRKSLGNIHPQIGYLYMNVPEKSGASVSADGVDGDTNKNPSLLINLAEEANKTTYLARQLGISPHSCYRSATAASCEPVNLYHKLGHGSLDMYILNPVADSKELKEFYQLWSKQAASFDSGVPFSLPNVLSICALLVWKPYNVDEKIVRILFPGNAPQHKVIEGFEKMKNFGFLKVASCTSRDLTKPPPVKKPLLATNKSATTTSKAPVKSSVPARGEATRGLTTRIESPRKELRSARADSKPSSPTKPARGVREENNKSGKEKERPKTADRETKPKSVPGKEDDKDTRIKKDTKLVSAPSPHKNTSTVKSSSPTKAASPPKSPTKKASSPPKSPTKTAAAAAKVQDTKSDAAAAPADQATHNDASQTQESETDQGQTTHQNVKALDTTISEARDAVGTVDDVSITMQSESDHAPKIEDLSIFDGEHVSDYPKGSSYSQEEEEKPQALPEPLILIESPSPESDLIPNYSLKMESDKQELSEFSRVEEELMELEGRDKTSVDPAQEIPTSPEPSWEDQQDLEYPSSTKPQLNFETPVFTNDSPDSSTRQLTVEHNIQYGIDDSSNGRDMGGIQEVDEEEHEDDHENDHKEDSNTENIETTPNTNQLDQQILTQEYLPSRNQKLQEGLDEGIEDDESPSLPPSSTTDYISKGVSEDKSLEETENDDRDSIDGGMPDDGDSDGNEHVLSKVNGNLVTDVGGVDHVHGLKSPGVLDSHVQICAEDESDDDKAASFDPLTQWGQPMGLPSPGDSVSEGKKSSRPNSTEKQSGTRQGANTNESRTTRQVLATNNGKKRPQTAADRGAVRPGSATKRPGTASGRAQSSNTKTPSLPPLTTFFVDLTYIPNHGDATYSNIEFFKRIRSHNYVISSLSPSPQILDSLLEAKGTWEQKDLEVTIIPTYDNETLRHWMNLNKDKLQESHVDVAPAVSRCTVQLQDLETSLPAFRLEV